MPVELGSKDSQLVAKKIKDDADLAWFDKIIAFDDLTICRLLADVEGLPHYVQFEQIRIVVSDGDDYYFNPLVNGDQCIALVKKHDVERTWQPYDFIGWSYHVLDGKNPIHITERQDWEDVDNPMLNLEKASCLAIILNKVSPDVVVEG